MQILLFNPENDLALAANDSHYTPPASARQMAYDLRELPLLWAQPDDIILLPDSSLSSVSPLTSQLSSPCSLLPWGWSPLLVNQLRAKGIDSSLLPTTGQMEAYREASSRRTAVELLKRLRSMWPEAFDEGLLVGDSFWCTTPTEVQAAIESCGGSAILKAPWSGSGRGIMKYMADSSKLLPWVTRTLHRQGGVEVEPLYDKVQDFAMEYWSEEGHVRDEGLSLFTTTAGGVYSGNLVASEEEKRRRLAAYIPCELLDETRSRLVALLNDAFRDGLLPAWYTGPFGIDMMICQAPLPDRGSEGVSGLTGCQAFQSDRSGTPLLRTGKAGGGALHPLIELNLRMTMGWVALRIAEKMAPGQQCIFRIVQKDGHYRYEINDTSECSK